MKFKIGNTGKEIDKNISYQSFPEALYDQGIWGHFAFVNDEDANIKTICSAYNTNRYSPGTVVVSNKIYNEFPIAQSAWLMSCQINRMYVDPYYRGKDIAKYSVITNDMLAKKMGYEIWSYIYGDKGGTIAGDQLYNYIYDLGFEKSKIEIDPKDIFQYRNFSHPINYIDKRIVYVEPTV